MLILFKIILTFDFRKNFLNCIVSQTNHLKKNIKFEKNLSKKN